MNLRAPPTRMALLRQRRRLALARRGHKLLEDKLEGLIRRFMETVDEYDALRGEVDHKLPETLGYFRMAEGASGAEAVEAALTECDGRLETSIVERRIMSVAFPVVKTDRFEFHAGYSALSTTTDFDLACARLRELMPRLLALASAEEAVVRMAGEVERTRRRVHALEYVLIPQLKRMIAGIAAKLEEAERSNRARLMKVKDILAAQDV